VHLNRLAAALLVAVLPALGAAQQLTVSAAASLTDAFKEIGSKFEAARPGVTLRFNFAASGTLIQQIAQGAPVDVFASADEVTVARGIEQKLLDSGSRRDFARNTLVLVAPVRGGPQIKALGDLGTIGVRRIAIGKPATTPAGRYAKEALDTAGLWPLLEPKFVFADTVRQVLDYVARGEADAGFVYRTDAVAGANKVKIALTVEGHTPVRYPAAVISESRHKALASDFIAYLSAPSAQGVMAKYGFSKADR